MLNSLDADDNMERRGDIAVYIGLHEHLSTSVRQYSRKGHMIIQRSFWLVEISRLSCDRFLCNRTWSLPLKSRHIRSEDKELHL